MATVQVLDHGKRPIVQHACQYVFEFELFNGRSRDEIAFVADVRIRSRRYTASV